MAPLVVLATPPPPPPSKVMAEIVAKYGSKEKELSARLLKKYGRPLPPSVPSQELQRVLADFGMEDQDLIAAGAGGAGPATAAAAAAAMGSSGSIGVTRQEEPAAATAREEHGQEGHTEGVRERPPTANELNFRSKFFDPLKV